MDGMIIGQPWWSIADPCLIIAKHVSVANIKNGTAKKLETIRSSKNHDRFLGGTKLSICVRTRHGYPVCRCAHGFGKHLWVMKHSQALRCSQCDCDQYREWYSFRIQDDSMREYYESLDNNNF